MSDLHSAFPGLSSRRTPLFAALLATVLSGCMGTGGRADNPMEQGAREPEEIQLLVRNNSFNRVTVYTSREHGSRRLGVVNGKSRATFRFEWHLPYIQLRIKFLAGSTILTETLSVGSNDLIELMIPAVR